MTGLVRLAAVYGDASSSEEDEEGARSSLPQSCPTPTDRATLPARTDASGASLDAPPAYAQPDGAVQLGCEVKLNDRVDDDVFGSGVIIGLPLESYESHVALDPICDLRTPDMLCDMSPPRGRICACHPRYAP
jgi:hypothetical protein